MKHDNLDFDPYNLAAVLYRPEDDVDTLLADFATDLVKAGEHVGGVVQRNVKDAGGCQAGMDVIDLMSGETISICQSLGSGASACKLDPAGLADASQAIARAVSEGVALVVVNKFSKQEAAGQGLRSEIAAAVMAGLPVLTAVPEKCLDAWKSFTGDQGTILLCARRAVDAWWADTAARRARMQASQRHRGAGAVLPAISPPSHLMT